MAVALLETPPLAICAMFPAYFAAAILVTRVRARIRVRWHTPPRDLPVMLPRVPETYDGLTPTTRDFRVWERPEPPMDPPDVGPVEGVDAEAERAKRVGRMFG